MIGSPRDAGRAQAPVGGARPLPAWELLVQLLEDGHPMQGTVLDHPPGARGFVLLVDLEGSSQTLYVKVQLGARCVIGRSFHYSYEPGLHGTPRVRRDD